MTPIVVAGVMYLPARGNQVLALDAQTGRPSPGFGRDGFAEITVPWNGVPVTRQSALIKPMSTS